MSPTDRAPDGRLRDERRHVDLGADETQTTAAVAWWPRREAVTDSASASSEAAADGSGVAGASARRSASYQVTRVARTWPCSVSVCSTEVCVGAQPLTLDRTGGIHAGVAPRRGAGHVERDEPLRFAHAAVAGQFGAGARGEQQARRARLASPGDAVGIPGQQRAAQLGVVDVLASIRVGPLPRDLLQLVGRLPERRRLLRPRVEGRQHVAGRGGAHHRAPAQAVGQQGTGSCDLDGAAACHQDRAQARVQRQDTKPFAKRGQSRGRRRRQSVEAAPAAPSSISRGGASNHSNVSRSAAPGQHVEHGRCKVDPRDVRLTMRAQAVPLVPEPHRQAWPETARPARALIGRVSRDALEHAGDRSRARRRSAAASAGRCRRRPTRRAR